MPEDNFELGSEQLDALRLETEGVSPAEKRRLSSIVNSSNRMLKQQYGDFIENPLSEDEVTNRFIFTDSDTYETFLSEWFRHVNERHYTDDKGAMRAYSNEGKFVIGFIPDYWVSVANKEENVKKYGSEEKARNVLRERVARNLSLHEIAHMYQDRSLPQWLEECGAYWYAKNVPLEEGEEIFTADRLEELSGVYDKLIEKYGDEVHKVYFGSTNDREVRSNITSELSEQDIDKLFPERYVEGSTERLNELLFEYFGIETKQE